MASVSKPPPRRRPSATPCKFQNCDRPSRAAGFCGGHYQQQYSGRQLAPLTKHSLSPTERFMRKICMTPKCWIWIGSTYPRGEYGIFFYDGAQRGAHRVAYELFIGSIDDGLQIDHRCHNTLCVNPEHLRAVTRKQNQEHRVSARVDSATGIRGVGWYSQGQKWRARASHNGKQIFVGYFDTPEDAENAVIAKRLELFTHNDADRSRP